MKTIAVMGLLVSLAAVNNVNAAEPLVLDVDSAVELALNHDPRISELEALVRHAHAVLQEAEGSDDLQANIYSFIGLSPGLNGGLFLEDDCGVDTKCENRRDRYKLEEGLSLWNYLDYRIIKPIYTFGKIENFSAAAKANIAIKQNDVRLQRAAIIHDVNRAYYGHLTARDTRLFLEDMQSRVDTAVDMVQGWLDDGEGHVKQADLYALQSATALAQSYIDQAAALERIALEGLRILTGAGAGVELRVADKRLSPVAEPADALKSLQDKALEQRPEMTQLEYGLKARRALVEANRAMNRPNIFVGFGGMLSYSPGRDRLDNPHIYDPFNDVGGTPLVGMQWEWNGGVTSARVAQAKAELDALVEKSEFARQGIPFQVTESYEQVKAYSRSVKELEKSSRAARRWMISTYTDFEAGLEQADKIVTAFQGYVLVYTQYLQTVFEYNMHVTQLQSVVGDYQ